MTKKNWEVSVDGGKYTFIFYVDGSSQALRYGEPWPAFEKSPPDNLHHALASSLKDRNEEIDRLRVQLAGCGAAALGATRDAAKQGDYGWSPAYQDVLDLRLEVERRREDPYAD